MRSVANALRGSDLPRRSSTLAMFMEACMNFTGCISHHMLNALVTDNSFPCKGPLDGHRQSKVTADAERKHQEGHQRQGSLQAIPQIASLLARVPLSALTGAQIMGDRCVFAISEEKSPHTPYGERPSGWQNPGYACH